MARHLIAAALLLIATGANAAPAHPDLLLVTLDTTRADALGAGTPTLAGLAREGLRYTRAYSPVPLTLPAHASIFTGLLPAEHGLRDNGWGRLDPKFPLLAEKLAQAGYRTAGFPASRVLDARFGLGRGFALYDDAMAAEQVGEYGYPERPAAEVVGRRAGLAGRHSQGPAAFRAGSISTTARAPRRPRRRPCGERKGGLRRRDRLRRPPARPAAGGLAGRPPAPGRRPRRPWRGLRRSTAKRGTDCSSTSPPWRCRSSWPAKE